MNDDVKVPEQSDVTGQAQEPAAVDEFGDVRQRLAALFPGERLVVWRDADGGLHFENQGR